VALFLWQTQKEKAMPEPTKNLDLLSDYADRPTLAQQWGTSVRTIANYEAEGLPSLMLGGRKLYNIVSAMNWLKGREAA
jgi:hypothetical protein